MRQRIEALGQIVEHFEPDILAFQEITPENLAVLREQSWLSRFHSIPPRVTKQVAKSLENYIFSLYPVDKWFIYSYRTFLGRERQLVVAEAKSAVSSSLKFVVAGTHLEPPVKILDYGSCSFRSYSQFSLLTKMSVSWGI